MIDKKTKELFIQTLKMWVKLFIVWSALFGIFAFTTEYGILDLTICIMFSFVFVLVLSADKFF